MSPKNIFGGLESEAVMVRAAALVPVIVLCFFVMIHPKSRPAFETIHSNEAVDIGEAVLLMDMRNWRALSWKEKELRVNSAIAYFRKQKNCAILRSPGHYVALLDRLLQEDRSVKNQNLLAVLRALAIREYDFYSGVNADKQALEFFGPELFRANLAARQAAEARLRPVDVKK